jgi:hypothetical protein
MATRRLNHLTPLKRYRFQRNVILLSLVIGLIIVVSFGLIVNFITPNSEILQTFSFFSMLLFSGGVIFARQILLSINMHYHYFRMIDEDAPALTAQILPFSLTFSQRLLSLNFTKAHASEEFTIFYQLFPKLPYVRRAPNTLVWVVMIHQHRITSHDEKLEKMIQFLKTSQLKDGKYLSELSLIFKEVSDWSSSAKDEYQRIINFSYQNRAIISLPCAVMEKKALIYVLRPAKQYPNKFYYALIKTLQAMTLSQG